MVRTSVVKRRSQSRGEVKKEHDLDTHREGEWSISNCLKYRARGGPRGEANSAKGRRGGSEKLNEAGNSG